MRAAFVNGRKRDAQTFVFFALTFGTLMLLCGLAIDSGLLFLAKARLSRAVDGAALAAVGNFNRSTDPTTNCSDVASIMKNFAVANYTDLGAAHNRWKPDYAISSTPIVTSTPATATVAATSTYNFTDGTTDANGQYRKYVSVTLTTGAGGQITSAICNARCPVGTYFIGAMAPFFRDLKVSAQSEATRNPRLIMIIVDRSGSMLSPGGGAYGLPQAIVQFLDFFDTSADNIGIVSFGSSARVEMPLTTNFLIAGTNILFDSYQTNGSYGVPGADPEEFVTNTTDYDPYYSYSGVRRLKFGGTTAADEGFRLGMETMMNNSGFENPDVVKYIVLFTDGAWNQTRTLLAAPGYTNWTLAPPSTATQIVTNTAGWSTNNDNVTQQMLSANWNLIAVPTFCEAAGTTNLLNAITRTNRFSKFSPTLSGDHYNDIWQSIDGSGYEPVYGSGASTAALEGAPMSITNNSIIGTNGGIPVYARNIDVWLQPGAVDYEYSNTTLMATYVSDASNPTQHILISQPTNYKNELVVPGYVADGMFFDGLDLTYWDDYNASTNPNTNYLHYRLNNFQDYFMWPDDSMIGPVPAGGVASSVTAAAFKGSNSLERELMFRNYPNLLTGFYITRPDEPLGPTGDTDPYTGVQRYSYGLGPYYPAAGFYWPFDVVGVDVGETYMLTNATFDPDPYQSGSMGYYYGGSRHESYSINMQSAAAAPEWSGEWFYEGTEGTNVISSPSSTTVSTLMTSKSQWQNNAPAWVVSDFDVSGITTNESAHNTNVIPTADVWRPSSYMGTYAGTVSASTSAAQIVAAHPSTTGGYVQDGSGNVYYNSMAWSGRPTHYFDFSQGKWVVISQNHQTAMQAEPLGFWKVQEYAWHARDMGVTIYTVGYGYLVSPEQQVILAQVANATNTTGGNVQGFDSTGTNFTYVDTGGTAISYNPAQPVGQQYFATNITDISNDFYQVGTAINAALTK